MEGGPEFSFEGSGSTSRSCNSLRPLSSLSLVPGCQTPQHVTQRAHLEHFLAFPQSLLTMEPRIVPPIAPTGGYL
eukprot:6451307-Amphidinium_carterae.1